MRYQGLVPGSVRGSSTPLASTRGPPESPLKRVETHHIGPHLASVFPCLSTSTDLVVPQPHPISSDLLPQLGITSRTRDQWQGQLVLLLARNLHLGGVSFPEVGVPLGVAPADHPGSGAFQTSLDVSHPQLLGRNGGIDREANHLNMTYVSILLCQPEPLLHPRQPCEEDE